MQQRRTVLVTGATDGIGRAVAQRLLEAGAHVLVHGRNPSSAERVAAELRRSTGSSEARAVAADLGSLAAVERLADDVAATTPRLVVLVNNAGIVERGAAGSSGDDHALTFAVNYLAPFVLTTRLLDVLVASTPSRVVNVSSELHSRGQTRWAAALSGASGRKGWNSYADAKLALTMFTAELAERMGGTGVVPVAVHPGFVATKLTGGPRSRAPLDADEGADPVARLVLAADHELEPGAYYSRSAPRRPAGPVLDAQERRRLWDFTESVVGSPSS